jgi:PAS domain S-box-containing protein
LPKLPVKKCGASISPGILGDEQAHKRLRESEQRFPAAINAVQASAHTGIVEQQTAKATLENCVWAAIVERGQAWDNARDMLAIIDASGIIRAVNPAWTSNLGWQIEDVAGRNVLDFIRPDDRAKAREALGSAAAGVPQGYECRARHKDGAYRTISWIAARDRDFVHMSGRDVTDGEEAATALRQSEAWMRAIFETSYQYKGIVALDGRLLKANPASLRGIKANREDVAGKPFWDTPWFAGTPGLAEIVKGAIAGAAKGKTFRQEVFINLPIGLRWFDFTIRPIRDANGEIVAIVPEAADITARRQAEEVLRQSQKLEVIGQLAGGIAHDFNNLLTPIVGSLDLIKRRLGGGDERTARLLSGAIQSADRARLLVQRLLAFGRRQHLDARAVDIAELVRSLGDLLARALGPRIEIRLEMEAGLPPANVDPHQLELALLNLAVNSRDAMPGGGLLSIAAQAVDANAADWIAGIPPGPYVCLAVTDTGLGMDQDTLARAVEPFFSTKGVGKGTGLGLSMVHGLAAQSGGKLVLDSVPGRGTTATLWLPAAGVAPRPEIGISKADAAPSRPLSVLLVDDDELVRQGTVFMLEMMGHKVVQVSSALAALDYFASGEACDLLVTDHTMPGMTGAELAHKARGLRPGLPAILTTGYADLAEPGTDEFLWLAKPFQEADLSQAVSEAVKKVKSRVP